MNALRGLVLASAAFAALCLGNVANAGIIFDNLTGTTGNGGTASSGGSASISSANNGPLGNSFTTTSGSNLLTDVKLVLSATTPTDGGSFSVLLMSNNASNNTPGSVLATLGTINDSSLTSTLANYDVAISTPYLLAASTRYYIELNGNPTSARWSYTQTNYGVGVANEFNFYAGSSSANSAFTPYQMQVTTAAAAAGAVPEPASLALSGIGLAVVAIARRRLARA